MGLHLRHRPVVPPGTAGRSAPLRDPAVPPAPGRGHRIIRTAGYWLVVLLTWLLGGMVLFAFGVLTTP